MKTRTELLQYFRCTPTQVERLLEIQATGAAHGREGWYPDGDFGSDADYCYGVGARINKLSEELDVDDDGVFDVYYEAHSEAFVLQPESCDYSIECRPAEASVRGNVLAVSPAADKAAEDDVLARLADGQKWAWCDVIVTCRFNDDRGVASLGAVSVENERAFKDSAEYSDLCDEAFADLQRVRAGE